MRNFRLHPHRSIGPIPTSRLSRFVRCCSSKTSASVLPLQDVAVVTTTRMNMFTGINDAMRVAMKADDNVILFGEDVGFGGVFRCRYTCLIKYHPS